MTTDREPGRRQEFLEPVRRFRVRRSPSFVGFMVTGGLLGLLAGFLVDALGEQNTGYGPVTSLAFFGICFAGVGVLLGALLAVLLDRK